MLVSGIGYLNSNSKSLYGLESNKNQVQKSQLGEGFGHVNVSVASIDSAKNSNVLDTLAATLQSLFIRKADDTKKYLSLIA